jgi:hypothetical protein
VKYNLLAVFTVFLLAKLALAGGSSVGNGGNTIVCADANGQIKSVELLDFYEARIKRGITPDLGDDSLSVDDKVKLALNRLALVDKYVADMVTYQYGLFNTDSVFLPGIHLVTVDDSDHLFVPAGCRQEQTAIQKAPEFPGDKLYNIDQDLWNHMDANNRAGLILHEIFYHMAIEFAKPDNSIGVRFFVSSIASAPSISLRELVEVFRSLNYRSISIEGIDFAISDYSPGFNRDGSFFGGNIDGTHAYTLQGKQVSIKSILFAKDHSVSSVMLAQDAYLKFGDQYLWFAADGLLSLSADETVLAGDALPQKAEFKSPGRFDLFLGESAPSSITLGLENGELMNCDRCSGTVTLLGQNIQVASYNYTEEGTQVVLPAQTTLKFMGRDILIKDTLDVTVAGLLRGIVLAAPTTFAVGPNQILFGEGLLIFDQNGLITSGYLAENTTLLGVDGTLVPYLKGMVLSFDTNGKVTRGEYPPKP